MKKEIEDIRQEILNYASESSEEFKLKFLSKKGRIQALFNDFRNVEADQKKEIGQYLNSLKTLAISRFEEMQSKEKRTSSLGDIDDMTRDINMINVGSRHPLSIVRREISNIFSKIGFVVEEGPEIEDDWHLFSALNFPPEHPARDMQDTFFVEKDAALQKDVALRTHTSSVQIRCLEKEPVPIRKIFPGRVYRNEAISARAHCMFHQVEGLYVDKNVSFKDLKQVLLYFAEEMFGPDTKIRLRPSYFPFTEPSAEMDITCSICGGKGCNICKGSGWVEILGCGMVDPNVLSNCNIDPNVYSGYAFGMGIERITMLKYDINDIRLFFDNDVRFLSQFKNA